MSVPSFFSFLQYAYTEQDALKTDKVNRSLSLVLSELSQQITSFNYFYENDLQAWCKKLPENITKSGPEFKRVHDLLKQFIVVSIYHHINTYYLEQ